MATCLPSDRPPPWLLMDRAAARLWREGTRWVVEIEIDGAHYTERDYPDLPAACSALAAMLRQHGERPTDLDQDECDTCDEQLDLATCSQCGTDAFVRTCGHGAVPAIRLVEGAIYCTACRP